MDKLCDKCIHCYKPTSVKDYFDKTMKMPDLHKWGIDVFKHLFWLCDSDCVSKRIHTNDSMIMKPCIEQNIDGNCESFKTSDAINIIPSTVSIEEPAEPIHKDDKVSLTVTVTPATIPAVMEDDTVIVPEHENDQDITYSYQWYRNGRKLFQEKKSTLTIDTSEVSVDTYKCEVSQFITNNGDGGVKHVDVMTNEVTITVEDNE